MDVYFITSLELSYCVIQILILMMVILFTNKTSRVIIWYCRHAYFHCYCISVQILRYVVYKPHLLCYYYYFILYPTRITRIVI